MVKPSDVFESKKLWKRVQRVHPNGRAASSACVADGGRYLCCVGKLVHLYGGAAVMRNGVIPVRWEGKCIVQELFVALSFSFSCFFSKPFDRFFLRVLVEAFLRAFSSTSFY